MTLAYLPPPPTEEPYDPLRNYSNGGYVSPALPPPPVAADPTLGELVGRNSAPDGAPPVPAIWDERRAPVYDQQNDYSGMGIIEADPATQETWQLSPEEAQMRRDALRHGSLFEFRDEQKFRPGNFDYGPSLLPPPIQTVSSRLGQRGPLPPPPVTPDQPPPVASLNEYTGEGYEPPAPPEPYDPLRDYSNGGYVSPPEPYDPLRDYSNPAEWPTGYPSGAQRPPPPSIAEKVGGFMEQAGKTLGELVRPNLQLADIAANQGLGEVQRATHPGIGPRGPSGQRTGQAIRPFDPLGAVVNEPPPEGVTPFRAPDVPLLGGALNVLGNLMPPVPSHGWDDLLGAVMALPVARPLSAIPTVISRTGALGVAEHVALGAIGADVRAGLPASEREAMRLTARALETSYNTSPQELKALYRSAAKTMHPDMAPQGATPYDVEKRVYDMAEVNAAFTSAAAVDQNAVVRGAGIDRIAEFMAQYGAVGPEEMSVLQRAKEAVQRAARDIRSRLTPTPAELDFDPLLLQRGQVSFGKANPAPVLEGQVPTSYTVANDIGERNLSYAPIRFATAAEADAYGSDLQGRWKQVRSYKVEPTADPVNRVWDATTGKALAAVRLGAKGKEPKPPLIPPDIQLGSKLSALAESAGMSPTEFLQYRVGRATHELPAAQSGMAIEMASDPNWLAGSNRVTTKEWLLLRGIGDPEAVDAARAAFPDLARPPRSEPPAAKLKRLETEIIQLIEPTENRPPFMDRRFDRTEPGGPTAKERQARRIEQAEEWLAQRKAAEAPPAAAKEPWQMTREEFRNLMVNGTKEQTLPIERQFRAISAGESATLPEAMKQYAIDFSFENPNLVRKFQDIKPGDDVIIYRSVSKSDPLKEIVPGDWIALEKSYAEQHGTLGAEPGRLIELVVKAEDISWAGTSADEFLYTPKHLQDVSVESAHEMVLRQALSEGRAVPPEVLADYPDLAPHARPPVEPPPAGAAKYSGVTKEASALLESIDAGGVPIPRSEGPPMGGEGAGKPPEGPPAPSTGPAFPPKEPDAIRTAREAMEAAKRATDEAAATVEAGLPPNLVPPAAVGGGAPPTVPPQPPAPPSAAYPPPPEGEVPSVGQPPAEQPLAGAPPEQPPAPAPTVADVEERISRFMERLATPEAQLVSEDVQKELADNLVLYHRLTNMDAQAQAIERVKADPAASRERVLDLNREPDPIITAEGVLLLELADLAGDQREVLLLAEVISTRGSALGQSIQLFSTMQRLSPSAIYRELAAVLKREADGHGGKMTVAMEKRIAEANEAAMIQDAARLREEEMARGYADLERLKAQWNDAQDEIDRLQGIKPGFVRMKRAIAEFQDFFAQDPNLPPGMSRGQARVNPFATAEPTFSEKVMAALRAKAQTIKDMDPGPEKDAAIAEFMGNLKTRAAAPVGPSKGQRLPKPLPDNTDAPIIVEEETGAGPKSRDFRYLTDDTVREVQPRRLVYSRQAINKVKAILKQSGAELTDEEADTFLVDAEALDELPEDERLHEMMAMVEVVRNSRRVQAGLERGAPGRDTEALLEQWAVDLERMTNPQERAQFIRLNSPDRLTVARIQAVLRETGEALPDDMARQALVEASNVRTLPLDQQAARSNQIVDWVKEYPPVKDALAERKTLRDQEAAGRREARQAARDIQNLEQPYQAPAAKPPAANTAERQAISGTVAILRKTGTQLTPAQRIELVQKAKALNALPAGQGKQVAADLIATVKQYDPVARALAGLKAVTDAESQARAKTLWVAKTMENLTVSKEVVKRDPTIQNAVNSVVGVLRSAKVTLSDEDAIQFVSMLNDLNGLPPEQMGPAIREIVKKAREYEPVMVAARAQAEKKARIRQLEEDKRNIEILMGNIIPEARVRAVNLEKRALAAARAMKAEIGVPFPPSLIKNIMDRARAGRLAGPGQQQDRIFHALMMDIKNLAPPSKWQQIQNALDLYRASQTAWDGSYPFRQGFRTMAGHPLVWAKIWGPMLRSMRSPEFARNFQNAMATRPTANLAHWSGLDFVEMVSPLATGEETFGNPILSRLPGYQGSERGFVVPGNWQRAQLYDNMVIPWFPDGFDFAALKSLEEAVQASGHPPEHFMHVGKMYNSLTGRGSVEWLKTNMPVMQQLFYATRWGVSKVEPYLRMAAPPIPGVAWTQAPLEVRAEYAKNLVGIYGLIAGAIGLGVAAGIWDSDGDPRSTNFGKVRFKGTSTWVDLTAGAGPVIRFLARIAPTQRSDGSWGGTRKTPSGHYVVSDMGDELLMFTRTQMAPWPGMVFDFIKGADPTGRSRDITKPEDIGDALFRMIGPLSWHDIGEAVFQAGLQDGVVALTSLVGMGNQTYTTLADIQNRVTAASGFKDAAGVPITKYQDLREGDRKTVNATAAVQAELERISSQQKVDLRASMQEANKLYRDGIKRMEDELVPKLAYLKGEVRREAIQKLKGDRFTLAKFTVGDPQFEAYRAKTQKTKEGDDLYAEQYWSAPVPERDGVLDFKARDATRAQVLKDAAAHGADINYITGSGEGTFRGVRFQNAAVRRAVEEYEADQALLRPYWDKRDEAIAQDPKLQTAQQKADAAKARGDTNTQKYEEAYISREVAYHRDKYLRSHPDLVQVLVRWGYKDEPRRGVNQSAPPAAPFPQSPPRQAPVLAPTPTPRLQRQFPARQQ